MATITPLVSTDNGATSLTRINTNIDNLNTDKAEKSNVLELDNTTEFTPDANYEPSTKKYVDDAVSNASFSTNKIVMAGNAGETVAAGNLLYFDTSDQEWKKADASTAATCQGVRLGFAQGAGSDGQPITGGVLISGLEENQTGLTPGAECFVSDTAGEVVHVKGTVEVFIGRAKSATQIIFDFSDDVQGLTSEEKDAIAGTSGTPSGSNKFVTDADTVASGSASAGKVVRYDGSAKIITGDISGELTDGSNADLLHVHGYCDKLSIAEDSQAVANTTTETTVFSITLPGGELGTANAVRIKMLFNNFDHEASSVNTAIRLKLGSTTMITQSQTFTGTPGTTTTAGFIEFYIMADGSTSAQKATMMLVGIKQNDEPSSGGPRNINMSGTGSATEDSTGNLTVAVTIQHNSANADTKITILNVIAEVIK